VVRKFQTASVCLIKSVVNLVMFMKKLANWLAKQLAIMDGYEPKDIENGDLVIHYQI
jgi:hypothetical protein